MGISNFRTFLINFHGHHLLLHSIPLTINNFLICPKYQKLYKLMVEWSSILSIGFDFQTKKKSTNKQQSNFFFHLWFERPNWTPNPIKHRNNISFNRITENKNTQNWNLIFSLLFEQIIVIFPDNHLLWALKIIFGSILQMKVFSFPVMGRLVCQCHSQHNDDLWYGVLLERRWL